MAQDGKTTATRTRIKDDITAARLAARERALRDQDAEPIVFEQRSYTCVVLG